MCGSGSTAWLMSEQPTTSAVDMQRCARMFPKRERLALGPGQWTGAGVPRARPRHTLACGQGLGAGAKRAGRACACTRGGWQDGMPVLDWGHWDIGGALLEMQPLLLSAAPNHIL